jgi:hypothetical protein
MSDLPFRSNSTNLSQDQLLLLDFLTMGPIAIGLLYRDKYPLHMNVPYSHTISDVELPNFLDNMVRDEILAATLDEDQPNAQRYGLSFHGGDLWCKERLPVWQRYCFSTTSVDTNITEVFCVDKNIGHEFLAISKALGYIPVVDDVDLVQWNAIPLDDLIDWHPLPSAWAATVSTTALT